MPNDLDKDQIGAIFQTAFDIIKMAKMIQKSRINLSPVRQSRVGSLSRSYTFVFVFLFFLLFFFFFFFCHFSISNLMLENLSPKNIIYYCPGCSKSVAIVGSVRNLLSCSGTHSKGLSSVRRTGPVRTVPELKAARDVRWVDSMFSSLS